MEDLLYGIVEFLKGLDSFLWSYVNPVFIIFIGFLFTKMSNFIQIKILRHSWRNIRLALNHDSSSAGVSPLRLFFTSIAGMVGIGNIVSVIIAVTIGGPGALVWLWVAGFVGMLVKYSEVYLGVSYRVKKMAFIIAALCTIYRKFLIIG